jgi:hypothetical protein
VNEPLTGAQATLARIFGPLEGASVPGGCDHCNADQTVEPLEAGVWVIHVWHDDGCPFFATVKAGRAA